MNQLPTEFWDSSKGKWNTHAALRTVNHWHISYYGGADSVDCDLMIVQCENGKFFINDNWGNDAKDFHNEVFNPFDKKATIVFFDTFDEVNLRTAQIVSTITGASVSSLLIEV